MHHRIIQMLPSIQLHNIWLGTCHGLGEFSYFFLVLKTKFYLLANRFLRIHCKMDGLKNDFIIIDPGDQLSIIKKIS
jgi:superfamily I DNA/RNA helicase